MWHIDQSDQHSPNSAFSVWTWAQRPPPWRRPQRGVGRGACLLWLSGPHLAGSSLFFSEEHLFSSYLSNTLCVLGSVLESGAVSETRPLPSGNLLSSCCCSVTESCLALCNPMDCSKPGFSVLHDLLELAQTHVQWVSEAIQPSHPLSPPSPSALNRSQR